MRSEKRSEGQEEYRDLISHGVPKSGYKEPRISASAMSHLEYRGGRGDELTLVPASFPVLIPTDHARRTAREKMRIVSIVSVRPLPSFPPLHPRKLALARFEPDLRY